MRLPYIKIIVIFCLVIFCQDSYGQVYQLMPQYGYQAPRMKFDSTLQIPTVCGVPTLKSVQFVSRSGAIAFDSCNNRFYTYNPKTLSWSQVSGGGGSTDTTSLSTRIDARVKYTDTASMLAPYLRKVDTATLSNRINLKVDSVKRRSDSVFAYRNGTEVYQFKDSTGNDTAAVVKATVRNAESFTITKGQVVFLFGATGDLASVKLAKNTSDTFSSKTLGIVKNDIAAGASGIVITQGVVEKLNTAAYSSGDILWLDSIAGQMTKIKPVAPKHGVFVGVVERANAGNGQIYVKPQNGYELGELHNVLVNNERQDAVFYFDSTNKLWKAQSVYNLVDTTKLSARIDQRVRYSDTTAMLAPYLRETDTASLSSRINSKLPISDTSTLQPKQLAAYSFQANGTSAAANGTATYFKDTSGTYTGSIAWTGTTAPSGTTNHSYRWTRIGKCVTLNVNLIYATNGGALTAVVFDLPSDAPTPAEPAGLTGASQNMYPVLVWNTTATNTLVSNAARGFLRNNSSNNAYEFVINITTSAVNSAYVTINYWTN
jgi:predicted RecA/RadA family phage recombinase